MVMVNFTSIYRHDFQVPVANYAFGMLFNIIAMLTPILMCLITTVRFIGKLLFYLSKLLNYQIIFPWCINCDSKCNSSAKLHKFL